MATIEYNADETPHSWKYTPSRPEKKGLKGWAKPRIEKIEKSEVGPGKYSEGIQKAFQRILKNSPNFSFSRSKTPSMYEVQASRKKNIPGIGTYKNSDSGFLKYRVTRSRAAVIYPYKVTTFTDSVIKKSRETPGPGAYEIIPPLKKY